MASFLAQPPERALPVLEVQGNDPTEVIWQMGYASLSLHNELLLPPEMATSLGPAIIEELKDRLCRYLGGVPTIAFVDQEEQVFRICRVPQLLKPGHSPDLTPSPGPLSETTKSQTLGDSSLAVHKTRASVKKVPRPPNAFILYRKEYHPILKQQNPDLHNNDISIILGRQWKSETESVKAQYKGMAEAIKCKHATDNPGYQYAPRKPSEKKRRMTARKMAELQAAILPQASLARMAHDMYEIVNHEQKKSQGNLSLNNRVSEDGFDFLSGSPLTAADILENRRPDAMSHLSCGEGNSIAITMPSGGNRQLQQEADSYSQKISPSSARTFNPSTDHVTTQLASHVTNDQDFFNSLVDWESIAADVALVKGATPEELVELTGVELGNPYLHLSEEGQRTAFETELERTMRLFQG